MSKSKHKKILFAVGGTGGHLLPAQALARELTEEYEVLFGGGKLSSNRYFHRDLFSYRDVASSTPLRGSPVRAAFELGRGVKQSLSLFKDYKPDLVVGFGSFHSFPILAAAKLKKVPYLLVEQNALPGRVNRLFASGALFSAIQFEEAKRFLKGKAQQATIPSWSKEATEKGEARLYFDLDPDLFTLLAFGGSQGASAINVAVSRLSLQHPFQVLHFCGDESEVMGLKKVYRERGILACVKPFEKKMENAWSAADLAICRSGAATLAEMISYGVPAVLIPWPEATDDHQTKNAEALNGLGGAYLVAQSELDRLEETVVQLLKQKQKVQTVLKSLGASDEIAPLRSLILKAIERKE